MISAIVLAAGRATRMGRTKQLLEVGGKPLVQHAIDAASGAGLDEIIVVLGHDAERVEAAIALPEKARIVVNPDYSAGQSTSLRAGLSAADQSSEAAVILLADQPGLTAESIRAIADASRRGGDIVRAKFEDGPGHPVLLSREVWPEAMSAEGDIGARELIAAHPDWVVEVAVPGSSPPDVDTSDDYRRLEGGSET